MNTKTRIEQIKARYSGSRLVQQDCDTTQRESDIAYLLTQLEKAREVLEFYGDTLNWSHKDEHFLNGYGRPVISEKDCATVTQNGYDELFGGKRARALLKEWGE